MKPAVTARLRYMNSISICIIFKNILVSTPIIIVNPLLTKILVTYFPIQIVTKNFNTYKQIFVPIGVSKIILLVLLFLNNINCCPGVPVRVPVHRAADVPVGVPRVLHEGRDVTGSERGARGARPADLRLAHCYSHARFLQPD